jgi:hypothetical protein
MWFYLDFRSNGSAAASSGALLCRLPAWRQIGERPPVGHQPGAGEFF